MANVVPVAGIPQSAGPGFKQRRHRGHSRPFSATRQSAVALFLVVGAISAVATAIVLGNNANGGERDITISNRRVPLQGFCEACCIAFDQQHDGGMEGTTCNSQNSFNWFPYCEGKQKNTT